MVSKEWQKKLRNKAISKIRNFDEKIEEMDFEQIRTLIHELNVHQIELELQNHELIKNQDLIEKEKQRFTQLFDNAPIGFVVVNDIGLIQRFNKSFSDIVKTDIQLKKTSVFNFFVSEDANAFRARFKAILQSSKDMKLEARLKTDKPSTSYVLINTISQTIQDRNELLLTITDISNQKRNETLLKKAVQEKDVLLHELHHRTKNNMQMVSSLISLKCNSSEYEESKLLLTDISNRIRSISIVHEKLCQSKNLSRLSMGEYMDEIVGLSMNALKSSSKVINVNKNIDETILDVDSAVACGLILNELLTNVAKHAFSEVYTGNVDITFKSDTKKRIEFSVMDDGQGLPDDFDIQQSKSLGFFIIKSLVESQLNGTINVTQSNGTEITIKFKAK